MATPNSAYDDCPPINATAVAVDKDNKNSNLAVRWAIDHLSISQPYLILIHVRNKSHHHDGDGGDHDPYTVFIPFRGYCARKGVQMKEVILDEHDVARALLDYINNNYINNIVVGASTRNALTRRLKGNMDVASILTKSAPEFCSVYVIQKGKMLSVRTAKRPVVNTAAPPKQPIVQGLPPHMPAELSGGENGVRLPKRERTRNGPEKMVAIRERTRSAPTNLTLDQIDIQSHESGSRSSVSSAHNSNAEENEFSGPIPPYGSLDMSSQNLDFCSPSCSPRDSSRQSAREIEAEMRRLKQELKQTMDMYSSACKEAISAKNKAKEIDQWKLEEACKFEEARLAEENALAIAEMEKAKCKAAIEAAEAAQRVAEMEAQRRIQAEMKAKKEADEKNRALTALAHNDVRYRKYTIEEIEEATENFAESMKIGEGGYGPVYKGKLDHTPVAIKVLRPDAAQGRKQFQQEVEVLSCIRYPNMVLLLGACPEYGCLVYEYMDNGSLEDRLLRRGNTPPIPWRKRFKIAAEISTALLFLHHTKPEPLVHRDLKPANILLDHNYVSKISDVGLARLVPASVADEVTQYHMTSAAGTFCYIDPEYQQTGMLTTKSDIYSLGIVLLQIITAKPAMGLSHHVKRSIEKGTFSDMLDPTVLDWPVEEALAFANLALQCTELRKKDRPDLGKVIVPELNRLRHFGKNNVDALTSHGYSSTAHSQSSRPSNSRTSITNSQDLIYKSTCEDGVETVS
ncbi:putative protein kinase RLK-Pelle-RLCK-IXb family [Rosa chinensis]|uniref:RING-type E3 ubiquitin transferase n=1 Tax=Rosa chinensis TaxID=74649 RepID=A0A2P6Q1D5_ROSCH|nr:U-box domain-containing protein 51 isoform X1 [Rosa chinensis]PRQ27995.1 putative protein kinase RLK-Pelle-RLCK-IXb family [Rosa chinensis]